MVRLICPTWLEQKQAGAAGTRGISVTDWALPFLENEVADARRLAEVFAAEFALFDEIYDVAAQYLARAEIQTHEANKVLASAILLRAREAARSVRILSALGLTADASVCARTLMEALAKIGNAAKDPEFLKKFDASALTDRLKLHNVMRGRPEDRHLSKDDVFADLKKLAADQRAEKLPTVEALLGNVGLSSAYDFAYRVQSGDAHVTPDSLKRYFVTDAKGEFAGMKEYPHEKEVSTVVVGAAISLLASLVAWTEVVGVSLPERPALDKKIAELSEARKAKSAPGGRE